MRKLCLITLILCSPGTLEVAQAQSNDARLGIDPDRYVTRFEHRPKLIYEPRIEYVEKTVSKGSWIPFLRSGKFERKQVPVVSWAPKWTSELQPVTDRITMRPSDTTAEVARIEPQMHQENHRSAHSENEQTDGWMAIGRSPTPNPVARPTENPNDVELDEVKLDTAKLDSTNFGGVQKFDGVPRVGMRRQTTRY